MEQLVTAVCSGSTSRLSSFKRIYIQQVLFQQVASLELGCILHGEQALLQGLMPMKHAAVGGHASHAYERHDNSYSIEVSVCRLLLLLLLLLLVLVLLLLPGGVLQDQPQVHP
jgi:hypothetical protein